MRKSLYLSFCLLISFSVSLIAQNAPIEDLYGSWSTYEFNNICNQPWNLYNQFDLTIMPVNTTGPSDTISINFLISTALIDTSFTSKYVINAGAGNYPLISDDQDPLSTYYNTLSLTHPDSLVFTSAEACLACSCGTINYLLKTSTNSNINLADEWKLYPNPTSDMINISSNKHSEAQLSLFNADGRLIKSLKTERREESISLEGLEQGLYYLEINVKSDKGVKKIFKL